MKTRVLTLILASLFLAACGKGFKSVGMSGSDSVAGQSPTPSPTTGGGNQQNPGWSDVDMEGTPTGGTNAGQLVVHVDQKSQSLLLVLPIPAFVTSFAQIEVPELPGAYFTSYQDPKTGGSSLAVNVPFKYLLKNGQLGPGKRLPNGDPLPYIPSGELPGFSIQFPQNPDYRLYLYVGTNAVAAFVELPNFGLPIGATFPVRNQTKTRIIGAIGYVVPKGTYAGGVYLATQIPDDFAAIIDDLIRW